MQNKILINKLRDNAELAWAAYGYFHLADSKYDFNKDEIDKKRLEEFRKIKKQKLEQDNIQNADQELQNTYPTPADILNMEYKYFKDEKGEHEITLDEMPILQSEEGGIEPGDVQEHGRNFRRALQGDQRQGCL